MPSICTLLADAAKTEDRSSTISQDNLQIVPELDFKEFAKPIYILSIHLLFNPTRFIRNLAAFYIRSDLLNSMLGTVSRLNSVCLTSINTHFMMPPTQFLVLQRLGHLSILGDDLFLASNCFQCSTSDLFSPTCPFEMNALIERTIKHLKLAPRC